MANTTPAAAITAAGVKDDVLHPAMDSIAAGLQEQDLLHRPETPEADSVVEVILEAAQTIDKLAALVQQLCEVNGVQIKFDRRVAGWADRLTTHLRDMELNGPADQRPRSGRRIAHDLIQLLDALAEAPLEGQPIIRKQLHEYFAAVPRPSIFRQAVYDHLGARRRPVLATEHQAWEQRRARRGRTTRRAKATV